MRIARRDARAYLTWSALALAAGLAFLAPFPAGSQEQRHWTLACAFAVLLGALAVVVRGLEADSRPRTDPVMIAFAALGGFYALQLAPLPAGLVGLVSPARLELAEEAAAAAGGPVPGWLPLTTCLGCTRDSLLFLAACGATFYAASRVLHRDGRWKIVLGAVAASGAALALFGVYEVLAGRGRLNSTYTNANRFAGLMAISGASALGLFLVLRTTSPRRSRRTPRGSSKPAGSEGASAGSAFSAVNALPWLALGAAVVTELALVFTLSRLGIASAFAAGLAALAVFTRRRSLWAVLAGVLLVLAANAVLAADPVLARYSVLFEAGAVGRGRMQCWGMALPLAADFPLTGSGAGTFRHAFAMYQDPSLSGWYKFAHNDYLNLLTDAGMIGFAAAAAGIAFLARGVVRLRRSPDASDRAIALAAFLAGGAMLLHSIADYPLRQPANALALALVMGIAWGRARARAGPAPARAGEGEREGGGPRDSSVPSAAGPDAKWLFPARGALAFLALVIFLPPLIRLRAAGALLAEAAAVASAEADAAGPSPREGLRRRLERRLDLLERAARLDTWDGEARFEAAWVRASLMQAGTSEKARLDAELGARRLLDEGRRVSPLDPRAYYVGALLDEAAGRAGSADLLAAFASRLAPAWPEVAFHVGRHFLRRWLVSTLAGEPGFGVSRWASSGRGAERDKDELFANASRSLALASRSPGARRRTIALVLAWGLSSREVDRLLEPDPGVHLALAFARQARGEHELACDRFARALAPGGLDRPGTRARTAYARSLLAVGRVDDALAQLDAALAAAPPRLLGGTMTSLARLAPPPGGEGALADYWAAVREHFPDERAALFALGLAEAAAGREAEAFEHLLRYAKESGDVEGFDALARLTLGRGELELASSFAARAAELEPGSAGRHVFHGGILERAGDLDGASLAYGRALTAGPRNLGAARAAARVELKAGRRDRAVAVWERFVAAEGLSARAEAAAREALADVYIGLLDAEHAVAELERALALCSRPADRERLRKKLEKARARLRAP